MYYLAGFKEILPEMGPLFFVSLPSLSDPLLSNKGNLNQDDRQLTHSFPLSYIG